MSENTSSLRKPETTMVDRQQVSCGGGSGADGHPKVFMDMGQAGEVVCKYCGQHFLLKA